MNSPNQTKPKKQIEPQQAIDEIQKARDLLWELYNDEQAFDDGSMVSPVLEIDRLLTKEQDKWKAKL